MGVDRPIDVTADQRKTLLALLKRHLPNTTAWVYGSRVKWTARPQSDLDLVVFAKSDQERCVSELREAFEESNLPFRVDLFVWDAVPEQFRKQIEAEHVVLVEREERGVASEWREVKLGELGEVNRGRSRHRPRNAPELYGGPYPFVQTGDIKASGGRITSHTQTYNEVGLAQSRLWPSNTMAITIAANIAETAILTYPACFPDSVVGFVAEESKCDVRFVEYMFRLLRSKIQRENVGTGSVQDNINLQTLDELRLLIPPLPEQRTIAHVLGTLDDKIELNRCMNETLEAMARALFKSWFIDFDPVRAKMEGRDPGLPKHLADLFPDRLVDSELGPIPEGWEVGVLDDVIELLSGGTPKTSIAEYWDGDIPWYTAKDAPSLSDVFVLETERSITQAGVENSAAKILPVRTTVITARGTVGRVACLGMPMAMNQTCYGIRGTQDYPDLFTYFKVRMTVDELQRRTHGTIFDTITRQTFETVRTVLPPPNLAETFESTINPAMERILSNLHESLSLTSLRDTLLPKLISGKLAVKDAEKFIGRVV